MTREEIKEIHEGIEQRGWGGMLKAGLKIMRPKISACIIPTKVNIVYFEGMNPDGAVNADTLPVLPEHDGSCTLIWMTIRSGGIRNVIGLEVALCGR